VHEVDEARLHQLRLRQRRDDAQQRLVGEHDLALGHGIEVAGEAEPGERAQEGRREALLRLQPDDLVVAEGGVLQEVDRLLEAGGDQEVARQRQLAHEELEDGGLRHAGLFVGLHHVQLVEIGQQQAGGVGHRQHLEAFRPHRLSPASASS
jgi:hypothetical protein